MFKSVFTKYITAFMLIIAGSFLALTLILCYIVDSYSSDVKDDMIERTAAVVSDTLDATFDGDDAEDFNRFVLRDMDSVVYILSTLSVYAEDVNIIVADAGGNIVADSDGLCFAILDGGAYKYADKKIPEDVMTGTQNGGTYRTVGDIGGIFDTAQLAHLHAVRNGDGELVGVVMAASESRQVMYIAETLVKTVILSCLWVMLAALVAIYFISDRIIAPLKAMSKAAKSFAAGKFDVRVPVRGRDEVAELATAFNSMAASIAKADDMRRTFLSSVSHDLRTPMTTISGFIDGILDGTIPEEKHGYYLDIIRTEVRRLARLVASLLDITRIQAGERKFTKTAFDICEMARLILISFEQKIDKKQLQVEFECTSDKMTVYADRDAIYQILYNICDNAVKFSKDGGVYRISVAERENRVYISVYNEGIGIPPEELPFVFERFYKSDKSRGLDKTGVGLGLYIAKTIIDAHDEEIWVKSVYGENCEFVFTLPFTPEAEATVKD